MADKLTLKIKGMSCGHCVNAVKTALESVEGVKKAKVDLKSATAQVKFDSAKVTIDQLRAAVAEAGYEATT